MPDFDLTETSAIAASLIEAGESLIPRNVIGLAITELSTHPGEGWHGQGSATTRRARSVEREMPLRDQPAEVLLQFISAFASQPHNIADGHPSVCAGVFDDP